MKKTFLEIEKDLLRGVLTEAAVPIVLMVMAFIICFMLSWWSK